MAMKTTAIRFGDEEREWIQQYADFSGQSFSDVVREATLDYIEDAADIIAYNEAIADDDGERHSLKDVIADAQSTDSCLTE